MHWLNFWALPLGAALAALPVIVHLLTRPRPARLPLSTIRFVREVVESRRARNRLRDLLILALRMAAIVLLASAIARPLFGHRPLLVQQEAPGETLRVVVLDTSQSMAAESAGIRSFERARATAARYVGYAPRLQANLVLAAATARSAFDRPSTNFTMLRDELAQAAPLPQRLNVQAALNRAGELLARGAKGARRELVLISDFQRSNWAAADFSPLPAETAIQMESVAPVETPPNLAVLRVAPRGRVEQGRPFQLEADVGNYSSTPRQAEAEIVVGDSTFRVEGLCPAGTITTLSAEVTLAQPGWQGGEARLLSVDDALSADNSRPLAIEVRPQPAYLLLSRQAPEAKPSSSYFLERALAPYRDRQGRGGERVVRADPARVEREAVIGADVVVLDHPGKLTAETIELLATLLRRGKGLLYVAAEPLDATNLKLLARAAGTDLAMPVEFMPPAAGQVRRNLFLAEFRRQDPPFSIFGEEALAATAPLRFSGGLASRRLEGALLDDVLASYDDQSACLVVTAVGSGTLAVLNADLAASNLPSSPVFVPLVGELVGRLLAGPPSADSTEAAACGEPMAVYLPPSAGAVPGLRIETPGDSSDAKGELTDESLGVMWELPAAGLPGVYRIVRDDRTVFALATAAPAVESDLGTLAADVMTRRLAGGRQIEFHSLREQDQPRDDTWTWLAVGCVACLLAEVCGLRAFRT